MMVDGKIQHSHGDKYLRQNVYTYLTIPTVGRTPKVCIKQTAKILILSLAWMHESRELLKQLNMTSDVAGLPV